MTEEYALEFSDFEREADETEQEKVTQAVADVLEQLQEVLSENAPTDELQRKFACRAMPRLSALEFVGRFVSMGEVQPNFLIGGLMYMDMALKTTIFKSKFIIHKYAFVSLQTLCCEPLPCSQDVLRRAEVLTKRLRLHRWTHLWTAPRTRS